MFNIAGEGSEKESMVVGGWLRERELKYGGDTETETRTQSKIQTGALSPLKMLLHPLFLCFSPLSPKHKNL